MKTHAKMKALPLGDIRAKGWIREQLLRNRDGMGGHLDELEPQMLATPYTTREHCECWKPELQAGWGAELSGNYWYGLIMLAYTLDDAALKEKAAQWVEAVLPHQEPDGYLGTYQPSDDRFDDFNAWGTNCGMKALLAFYEATGREDVLSAVHRCMIWFCENWKGKNKTRYAGIVLLETASRVYELTGDERLLHFCNDYIDFLDHNDLYDVSRRAFLSPVLRYSTEHSAGYASKLWAYCGAYKAGGDKLNLRAAENAVRKLENKALQLNGGIATYAEFLAPRSGSAETEYCAYSYFQAAMVHLLEASGKSHYGDLLERVTFNGAQGARKKDEKAIPYLSSVNQLAATRNSDHATFGQQLYAPCFPTACCPTVSVWVMPNYVRSLAMEGERGLTFPAYGPAEITWQGLTITEDTAYPFRDTITFRISGRKNTTLRFRLPEWCRVPTLTYNGKPIVVCPENGYCELNGDFRDGDEIRLRLPMELCVSHVDDRDAGNRRPIAVEYGALLMAYHIPERWRTDPGTPNTPLPEGWNWWRVDPLAPKHPQADAYEQNGIKGHMAPWYFAVDETLSPEDIRVELCDGDGYVWEEPRVKLYIPAYKALHAYPPYGTTTIEPFECPTTVYGDAYELELVPFGCTTLRIAYLPRAQMPPLPMPEPNFEKKSRKG